MQGRLTPRERELVLHLAMGHTMTRAAEHMLCSFSTARELSYTAREKTQTTTLAQLVGVCVGDGVVEARPNEVRTVLSTTRTGLSGPL